MAFRDSDGRITIDEIAADKDIKQLRSSIEDMQKGLAELQEILAEAEDVDKAYIEEFLLKQKGLPEIPVLRLRSRLLF